MATQATLLEWVESSNEAVEEEESVVCTRWTCSLSWVMGASWEPKPWVACPDGVETGYGVFYHQWLDAYNLAYQVSPNNKTWFDWKYYNDCTSYQNFQ